MTTAPTQPRITPEGIYGSLAIAVVCLAWEGEDLLELGLEVIFYSTALWLFHIYARTVHGGWEARNLGTVRHWAVHEWPHLEAAVPALVAVLVGWLADLDPIVTSDVAMGVTIANLLVWQVLILRPGGRSAAALVATLAVNVLVLAALIALRLRVK